MNPASNPVVVGRSSGGETRRLDALDATRAFALVLGVVFHASLSFQPVFMGWAVQDVSTGVGATVFSTISHSFRMELFFLLAGFLGRASYERTGAGCFLRSRLWRIGVPWLAGWFVLRPLLVSGWIMGSASLRGDVEVVPALWGGVMSLGSNPAQWWTGTHLWFLYYLLQVTILAVMVRGVVDAVGGAGVRTLAVIDRLLAWLGPRSWAPLVLAVPTAVVLGFMTSWGVDTPDRSLVPHLPALAVYFGSYALGWLLHRQDGLLERWGRWSAVRVVGAVAGAGCVLALGRFERDPAQEHLVWLRAGYAAGYGVLMWSLVFLTLGAFQRWCSGRRPGVRYVSDASYWIYLVHLPLVVWLQVAVAEWPGPWSLKLAGISVVTVGCALVSYDLFVRSTALGAWLNGRRRDRVLLPWCLGLFRRRPPVDPVIAGR